MYCTAARTGLKGNKVDSSLTFSSWRSLTMTLFIVHFRHATAPRFTHTYIFHDVFCLPLCKSTRMATCSKGFVQLVVCNVTKVTCVSYTTYKLEDGVGRPVEQCFPQLSTYVAEAR